MRPLQGMIPYWQTPRIQLFRVWVSPTRSRNSMPRWLAMM